MKTAKILSLALTLSLVSVALPSATRAEGTAEPNSAQEPATVNSPTFVSSAEHLESAIASVVNQGGGTVVLSNSGSLNDLHVPVGVTVVSVLNEGILNIANSLVNSGTIIALAGSDAVTNLQISAASILNNSTGVISNALPANLSGLFGATGPMNLSLFSAGDFSNFGSISSTGNLAISGGGNITNTGTMTANLSTALSSLSGIINNQGTIAAVMGNVSFATTSPVDLVVNNTRGLVTAAGDINFGTAGGLASIGGGKLDSAFVNFNAQDGVVRALVDEISGTVNVSACESHIGVSSGQLTIGNIDLSGDPTFVNSGGSVVLVPNNGTILTFSGQDLAILASGDVVAGGGLTGIDLSSNTVNGGTLFISAGIDLVQSTGGLTISEPPTLPSTWTLGGTSATGGRVDLAGVSINTSTSAASAKAGNVTITAADNNLTNEIGGKGTVAVGAINATSLSGAGGDVKLIAQAGDAALSLAESISTQGGTASGSFDVVTGQPIANGVSFLNGTQSAGTLTVNTSDGHDDFNLQVAPGVFNGLYGNAKLSSSGTLLLLNSGVLQSTANVVFESRNSNLVALNGGAQALGTLNVFAGIDVATQLATFASLGELTIQSGSVNSDFGNSLFLSFTAVNLLSGSSTFIGPGTNVNSLGNINIGAGGHIDLASGSGLTANNSILAIAGNTLTINPGVGVSAGSLSVGAPVAGLLTYDHINTYGGVFLVSENDMSIQSDVTTNGLDLIAVSKLGDVMLGNGVAFTGNGGNIAILAGGSVTGSNNIFTSRAAGLTNNFGGGVIEISSGVSFNPLVLALTADNNANNQQLQLFRNDIVANASKLAAFAGEPSIPFSSPVLDGLNNVADPALMGNNVNINNNGINTGLVFPTTIGGGVVDVSGSQISTSKGAVLFDAVGAGAQVLLPGSQFNTESYSVLSSDFDTSLPELVTQSLDGITFGDAGFRMPRIFSTDLSNINIAGERQLRISFFLQPTGVTKEEVRTNTHERLAFLSGFVSSSTGMIDTGRSEISRVSGVRIVNTDMASASSGGRSVLEPLNIVRDAGTVMPVVRVGERRTDLVLFTSGGQVLSGVVGGSKGGTAVGARGTTVSNDREALVLHGGRLYADAGEQDMVVKASFGNIVLKSGTTAAIVADDQGGGRLVVIGGGENAEVLLTPPGSNTPVALKPGEQANIRLEDTTFEHASEGQDPSKRMIIVKGKAPVSTLLEGEQFYSTRSIRLGGGVRPAYERMIERINRWSVPSAPDTSLNATAKVFDPGYPTNILAEPGSMFQQGPAGQVFVKSGMLFTHANSPQTLVMDRVKIACAPGSNTTVFQTAKQTRVLSFSGPGDAVASIAQKKISLQPGQELMLQGDRPTRNEALADDGIARRSLTNLQIGDQYAVIGDFSIISAIQNLDHLRTVRTGPEHKDLRRELLKTAVVVGMVTGRRGQYFMQPKEKAIVPANLIKTLPDVIALKSDASH
ncbi:MAG: hypothetical protein K2W95_18130 [Candidatus Obscuribacterales bacterium]|nr:hypothetical protein [Candidatus Obscuribacterales bacterium]